jgi:acetolactate synthase-1/2/3 large subunit
MPAPFSVAEAYLELLAARGIDYLFLNAGTDFAPLVEAYARAPDTGLSFPRALPAAHENAAVCMAHGAYLMTGRPQAVMVHVNVGLANALMGVINASSDQIPMLFTSGRTPLTDGDMPGSRDEFIHWTQEMYDQGGMLREFVKWDYELRGGHQLQRVVDRALSIAGSGPKGPVYLSLPREILASEVDTLASSAPSAVQPATTAAADGAAVARAAQLMAAAQNPLVITARSGRYAWPVVEFRSNYVCLPGDHPMHGGHDVAPWLTEADAVLILEAPVPWLPKQARPPADCRLIQVGADPLFQAYPVREFGRALNVTAEPAAFLAALETELSRVDAAGPEARRNAVREQASALRPGRAAPADDEPLTYAFASQCINDLRTPETTIFNEIGVQRPYMSFTDSRDFFGSCMAGGLGWGLPAALGAKVAAPERTLIATLGDGSYMLANPLACHQFAAAHELPFLTILFNNVGWDSVRHAARLMYPQGHAAQLEWPPLSGLPPSPDFAQVAAACGGYGARVNTAGELPAALEQALHVVRHDGRQALLDLAIAG